MTVTPAISGQASQERNQQRALVLGGVAWNEMVYLDRFPDPTPQTVFAAGSHRAVGSSGAGKALNLRRLGWDVTFWAAIGDDEDGRHVTSALEGDGIRFVPHIDPAGTTHHVNLMDPAGDRISIFARSGTFELELDHASILSTLGGHDLVSVTIYHHCRGFLPILAELGVKPWIDIHDYDGEDPYHQQFIDAAAYLTLSTQALPKWRGFAEERLAAGTRVVLCSHGDKGASALTDEGWAEADAAPIVRLVDTNGAGDALTAAFAAAYMDGGSTEEALHSAVLWAARAVESPELAPVAGDPATESENGVEIGHPESS